MNMVRGNNSDSGFVTVGRFPNVADLIFVEAELREREIEYQIFDRNTVEVAPQYAAAIGGARLQVRRRDANNALAIIADLGIVIEREHEGSVLLEWFDRKSSVFPIIGSLALGKRFVIMAAVIVASIVVPSYCWTRPTDEDLLIEKDWCVATAKLDGKDLPLETTGFRLMLSGCPESVRFGSNGSVSLPGIRSREVTASWHIRRGQIMIDHADTLAFVYEGNYDYSLDGSHLRLWRDNLLIVADEWSFSTGL